MTKVMVHLLFAFFLLEHKVTYASMWAETSHTELKTYLQGFILESFKVNTIFACYRKCEDNIICASINMNLTDMTCELKYSTKTRHPKKILSHPNMMYMEMRDEVGSVPDNPIQSCKWLKNIINQSKSGVYWMKINDPSSDAFRVFCEMNTDGGGWTLVYSYYFTQFNNFASYANSISPVPNWPVHWSSSNWSPQSTVTPLSESIRSAMDFSLWKKIGNEFLLAPNITNWVSCVEGSGSLVEWRSGTTTCRVVKAITSICTNIAPDYLIAHACGLALTRNGGTQFILDGNKANCYPTHDPCGSDSVSNHQQHITNPGGALYIR